MATWKKILTSGSAIVVDTIKNPSSTVAGTQLTGSFTGSFTGDGSNLTGTGFNIDELSNSLVSGSIAIGDLFAVADINDSNEEKKITFRDVRDAMFEDVSGDATILAGGSLTIADNAVSLAKLAGISRGHIIIGDAMNAEGNLTFDGSTLNVTGDAVISGDLTINGDLTTIATTNTTVEDQLMFLGTGSAGTNKDVGIIAQSGSTDLQGSAFYNDTDSERWSVAKSVNHNATSITPLQFVTTVKTDTVNPDSTSGSYGAGEMHVNTTSGEIWIRFDA